MVILKLNDWIPINGIEHLKTTWLLSVDEAFTNVVGEVVESAEKLTLCVFDNITVPAGMVYYAKAKRHFNTPNSDYWTPVKQVINADNSYGILLDTDIQIDTPFVYVNIEDLKDSTKTSFEMKTSKFRGNDGHVCTHWAILSGTGNVLWKSIEDNVNLESITIDKTHDMLSRNRLEFVAVHTSTNGVESPIGSYIFDLSEFNYEVDTKISDVTPLKDLAISFSPIDKTKGTLLTRVALKDANSGNELFSSAVVTNKVTIPWYVLLTGADLLLYVYAYDISGNLTYSVKSVTVQDVGIEIGKDPDYVYNDIFAITTLLGTNYIPNGVVANEIAGGVIYTPVNGANYAHKLIYDDVTKTYIDTGVASGLSMVTSDVDNTYIKYLNSGLVLVDAVSGEGVPIFLVYLYDASSNNFILQHSLIRRDETSPVGRNNGIVQISPTEFIYLSYGSDKLRKYDILKNELTELGTVPLDNLDNGILFKITNNRLLIIGGSSFTNCIYQIDDGEFRDGISTVPGSFINRDLKTQTLINNDVLIFKVDHVASDTEASVIHFVYETGELKLLNMIFDSDKYPKSSIGLRNGEVFLTRYNYKEYWEEKDNERVNYAFA